MYKLRVIAVFVVGVSSLAVQAHDDPYPQDFQEKLESSYNDFMTECPEGRYVPGRGAGEWLYISFPLYACSGLIVRGTRQVLPDGQNAWDPYPEGRTADTSFSYLRADIKMSRLAWSYTNGFIIDGKSDLKTNCFYPLDAESDQRADKGCGAHEKNPSADPQCPQDVTLNDSVPAKSRCRYDLRVESQVFSSHPELEVNFAFHRAVAAAAKVSLKSDIPNDLKIETWKKGCDSRLKIRAFFYVNAESKSFAERDRQKYLEVCGLDVPLVYMKFPASKDGLITFDVIK